MATKVYVEPSGRRIEPFGDTPGQVPIQNRLLADWQEEMIEDAGLERIANPTPPCLLVPDTLFTNGVVLRRFVEQAGGRNAVLVLRDSVFARTTTPVQPLVVRCDDGFRFAAVRFLSGGDEPATDVPCDPEEKTIPIPAPAALTGGKAIELALARHPVITVHHWVHILWANQAAAGMLARQASAARFALRVAWLSVRVLSLNRWRWLGKANKIGRGCNIHPTALIEGSTLEDNVTVGAFARVLFSRVGRGAMVMAGAQVEASVLGESATVGQDATIRLCVLYPGSLAGQWLMQMCVFGRDAVTFPGGFTLDFNLDRDARVRLDGISQSSGTRFLGSAFGHGCRVGAGTWLAQGRMIPNGVLIVRSPDLMISRIPADLPAGVPLANHKGTLRPLRLWHGMPSKKEP